MADVVYADYNATTPVDPEVYDAMRPYLTVCFGNPSSGHAYGRRAALAVEEARQRVADFLGARAGEIIFTSGGTESNNLALLGAVEAPGRILTSPLEHPSVYEPIAALESRGWRRAELAISPQGVIDLDAPFERAADLVSCMLAQNETGVLQPVGRLSQLVRAANEDVVVHCDAAQAAGKIAVNVAELDVDLLTIVGHKLYGPKGVGALYVRGGRRLRPLMYGGGQEGGGRPGTEPVAAIVGLGVACARAAASLESESSRIAALRDDLWRRIYARVPSAQRTGEGAETLPNTLHLCFPGCDSADLLAAAPTVAASTGSACHAGGAGASRVLAAMGWEPERSRGAVRLSLGRFSTAADVQALARALCDAAEQVA